MARALCVCEEGGGGGGELNVSSMSQEMTEEVRMPVQPPEVWLISWKLQTVLEKEEGVWGEPRHDC